VSNSKRGSSSRRSRRSGCARVIAFGLAAVPFLGFSSSVLASAWTLPQGEAEVIVTSTFTSGDRLFDARGRLVPVSDYQKFELTAYGQFGITDWATAIIAPSLRAVSVDQPYGGDHQGLGYSEFGGLVRLARTDASSISVQATARLPGALNRDNPAEIGNTDPEFNARLLLGHSFELGEWDLFIDLQAAYRVRAGPPPDEIRADLTLGIRPADRWLLLGQSFNVVSIGSGSGIFRATRYHKLQGSVVYELTPDWAVQFGVIATVAGENALRERGVIVGVWRRF
jgi:protein XagA